MPTYGYICDNSNCKHEFEVYQSFTDEPLKVCPECKQPSLYKKIYTPMVFVKSEPTTISHLAARNTEKMGHYEYQEKSAKRKQRVQKASEEFLKKTGGKNVDYTGELPWWRSGAVLGLPKEEKPISMQKVEKIVQEDKIVTKPPPKRKKK